MSTITVPRPAPTPSDDAESLRKALQGWRADKGALIEILCRRTAAQRAAIRRAYAFLYREPLLNCFRNRLSHHCRLSIDFWRAMIFLTMDPAERDANLVHEALKRQKDESYVLVLIEVSCASTPDHLVAVRNCYRNLFGCSIEEDVASATALREPLKKLLVSLASSYRYAGEHVDMDVAKLEAAQLSEAIRDKKQLHGKEVVRIVSTRSKSQLRATFQHYKEEHGTDIVEDINSCCRIKFARMLKSAIWCLTSPEKHFVEVIRHAVLGLGTFEDMLTRVIVSRAEIDMKLIKEEYKARCKSSVTRDVAGDTSFSYRAMLLALVGIEE